MVCVCSQAVWNFQKPTLFEYMPPEKLCFAGRVGKTSLVLRYVENVFSDKQVATVQASYLTKRLTVDGQSVTLSIWDTAGQERFHALGPIYYRDADGSKLQTLELFFIS